MSKELEAFERIRTAYPYCRYDEETQDLNIVETALKDLDYIRNSSLYTLTQEAGKKLKALEVIKEKGIHIAVFKTSDDYRHYNIIAARFGCYPYDKEEYELLKEVLL